MGFFLILLFRVLFLASRGLVNWVSLVFSFYDLVARFDCCSMCKEENGVLLILLLWVLCR